MVMPSSDIRRAQVLTVPSQLPLPGVTTRIPSSGRAASSDIDARRGVQAFLTPWEKVTHSRYSFSGSSVLFSLFLSDPHKLLSTDPISNKEKKKGISFPHFQPDYVDSLSDFRLTWVPTWFSRGSLNTLAMRLSFQEGFSTPPVVQWHSKLFSRKNWTKPCNCMSRAFNCSLDWSARPKTQDPRPPPQSR